MSRTLQSPNIAPANIRDFGGTSIIGLIYQQ